MDFGGNFAAGPDGRVRPASGLHVAVASHQATPAVAYNCGTSFAAPRVSHKLALVLSDLLSLGISAPSSALLKAFLVNSATYRAGQEQHAEFTEALDEYRKGHWLNVLGYGQADGGRATDCDDYSYLLYYQGVLDRNKIAFFDVPVPASLAGAGKKRLTVTVASTPEAQKHGLQSYLGTTTKWRMFRGDVNREEVVAAMSKETEEEGSGSEEEEEGPKELKFSLGVTKRSRGVIQHAWMDWTQHKAEYSAGHYTLAVASYERWGRETPAPLPFAVVVRVEDISRSVKVYSEVRGMVPVPAAKT